MITFSDGEGRSLVLPDPYAMDPLRPLFALLDALIAHDPGLAHRLLVAVGARYEPAQGIPLGVADAQESAGFRN